MTLDTVLSVLHVAGDLVVVTVGVWLALELGRLRRWLNGGPPPSRRPPTP